MRRRQFLSAGTGLLLGGSLSAAIEEKRFDAAAEVLRKATESGQVTTATIHVFHGGVAWTQGFGRGGAMDGMFLLGSISKPIAMTALMTLFDQGELQLDDPLAKFVPTFTGDGRGNVTIRQLLTHTAGLPDQLPENDALRKRHTQLPEFIEHAIRTPLLFAPGTKYQYASMGILLAAHVAERISGLEIRELVDRAVFRPLSMRRSAQGLGRFELDDFVLSQTEFAAPESGAGDPTAKEWDWNSRYWRALGAPWGGTQASAPDLGKFLGEFLFQRGAVLKPETSQQMVTNHNPRGFAARGLGFAVGATAGSAGCSEQTFGHTGSTGTIAWADPASETMCVVLTSLPGRAVTPHPRQLAADSVAAAVNPR